MKFDDYGKPATKAKVRGRLFRNQYGIKCGSVFFIAKNKKTSKTSLVCKTFEYIEEFAYPRLLSVISDVSKRDELMKYIQSHISE